MQQREMLLFKIVLVCIQQYIDGAGCEMYACDAAVENNDRVKMHFDCKLKSVMGTLILRYDIKIPYGW